MNQELPDVQTVLRKGIRIRDQIANIYWIIEKAREFQKNVYSSSLTTLKHFTVWLTTNCGKFLKRWEHQTTLPVSWEACVWTRRKRTGLWKADWFKFGNRVCQGCILSYCLFNYMQSISCEMPGWKIDNLGIRLPGEISRPQICRWYHSKSKNKEKLKSIDEGKRGEQKTCFKM